MIYDTNFTKSIVSLQKRNEKATLKWRKITELVVESNSKIQFGQLKKIIYNINMLYDFYNALLISKKINLMIYDDVK